MKKVFIVVTILLGVALVSCAQRQVTKVEARANIREW